MTNWKKYNLSKKAISVAETLEKQKYSFKQTCMFLQWTFNPDKSVQWNIQLNKKIVDKQ